MTTTAPVESKSTVAVGGAGGVVVETTGTVGASPVANTRVKKVIVAVHGVGSQVRYATIQAVVGQFCRYYHSPPAIPLGSFHNAQATFAFGPPLPAPQLESLAFAEVYWARVPQEAVSDHDTLEEARKWTMTLVERLRLRYALDASDEPRARGKRRDFELLRQVLSELIQTVTVMERLCFIADRAGLFTFDLRRLLDDYLGDVQVVAEFGDSRRKILDAFSKVMCDAHAQYPDAELHIVAHSEGTVVTMLGVLEAFRDATPPPWTRSVRGLMTLGSPIDKHLTLWPELFAGGPPTPQADRQPIDWCNYYDRGDPIGFELDTAREWIETNGWSEVFRFHPDDDIGFIRYPFPGKAHVDYWEDETVFRHFIAKVVKPEAVTATKPGTKASRATALREAPMPTDDWMCKWSSTIVPYLLVYAVLFLASYFPFKAIYAYANPHPAHADEIGALSIAIDVASSALLMLGMTVATRVPQMTRAWDWRVYALATYAIAAWVACLLLPPAGAIDPRMPRLNAYGLALPSMAVVLASLLLSRLRPRWGFKPLLFLGSAMLFAIALHRGYMAPSENDERGPLWPVIVSLAGFIYLWWLAGLMFDLMFVWHVQIRDSRAMHHLRRMMR